MDLELENGEDGINPNSKLATTKSGLTKTLTLRRSIYLLRYLTQIEFDHIHLMQPGR